MNNYIAIDIGASSGRAVASYVDDGKIKIKEINRFANGFTRKNRQNVWDIDYLFEQILMSLNKAKLLGIESCYLSIDTWGVDYIFLDQKGKRLQEVVSYRDSRTNNTMDKVFEKISKEEIYKKTGIQFLSFNTLYQLYEESSSLKKQASTILLVPDYLNYLLTGVSKNEITNLSTTQLMNVYKSELDQQLLKLLDISQQVFPEIVEAGTYLGEITLYLTEKYDLPITHVYATTSHDTASAVLGAVGDRKKKWAFLSSGTWSLIGQELNKPIISKNALNKGYSNERGFAGTYRFLKNIIGMWIVQRVRKDWPENYTFPEIVEEAKKNKDFKAFIDFNDERFINPKNMIEEIQRYCKETNQKIPKTIGEIAQVIYLNLAIIYAISIEDLKDITKSNIEILNIVGGGSNNNYLNELTSQYTNCEVIVGPIEATVFGNLAATMIATKQFETVEEVRESIGKSNNIIRFKKTRNFSEVQKDIEKFKEVTQYEYRT
ncbi:rhamnulokinase [Staphylococcus gallinarum]|uniref:Rhamnulokinase n=2 Tax=Staphylococcus gallinarum TaxID=1293 RepID=A0ABQ0XY30_STAGA|nr:rhamnulokinase family protein [Staphylococcus gallinarum]KIR12314.1 rhamnulokinase [Staphylococcus gallinarum]RTX79336.1 rhamnulokinase [Staphylococcus gallinarum]GEQ04249.1 rhamnulokinase [Staphylococcus gallinarum]